MAAPSRVSLPEKGLNSALARELARLGATRRSRLQISDDWLVAIEIMYVVAAGYARSTGPGWWPEVEAGLAASTCIDLDAASGREPSSTLETPPWVKNLPTTGWKHVHRTVGAGAAMRLRRALEEDLEVWTPAMRKGLRDLLPLARALDLCVGTVDPVRLSQLESLRALRDARAVDFLVKIDVTIQRKLEQQSTIVGPSSLASIIDLLPMLGSNTENRVVEQLVALRSPLLRKLRGAREVIGATSDDVSQAANSLIEFIDRLFRSAFTPKEVLTWVSMYLPHRYDELTFRQQGCDRPTRRAEALCLMHAGCAPPEEYSIAEAAALALANSRNSLQGLKHADCPTELERQNLVTYLDVVEAAFLLVFQLGWRAADETALTLLRQRLSLAA